MLLLNLVEDVGLGERVCGVFGSLHDGRVVGVIKPQLVLICARLEDKGTARSLVTQNQRTRRPRSCTLRWRMGFEEGDSAVLIFGV